MTVNSTVGGAAAGGPEAEREGRSTTGAGQPAPTDGLFRAI